MHTHTKALWLPKRGNVEAEYEDAFRHDGGDGSSGTFRCAVADGATEASFSQQWAQALARAYGDAQLRAATFADDVTALRTSWQRAFARHVQQRTLPWYAEQKASLGAFAALVGLELQLPMAAAGEDGMAAGPSFEAVAVGDCNLFLLRAGALELAFPLTRADQFSGGPFLIGSNAAGTPDPLARHVLSVRGDLQAGDVFYLMSDALACWFLRTCEDGTRPWQRLEALPEPPDDAAAFAQLVEELRSDGSLHNDDVTFVRVAVEGAVGCAAAAADEYRIEADETTPF